MASSNAAAMKNELWDPGLKLLMYPYSYVTLNGLINSFEPQFPHLKQRTMKSTT